MTVSGSMTWLLISATAPARNWFRVRSASSFSNDSSTSTFAGPHQRGVDDPAPAHEAGHATAALRHAVHLGLLGLVAGRQADVDQHVAGQDGALSADAGQQEFSVSFMLTSLALDRHGAEGNGIARADLGADLAAGAHQRVDQRLRALYFSSSSSLFRMAGQPMRKHRAQPLHLSASTSSGTHFLRWSGKQGARLDHDQHRGFTQLDVFLEGLLDGRHVQPGQGLERA